MSTLKADTLQAKTTNGTLTLANNGTGKVELPADATIGGVAMTTTFASGATTAEKSNIMLNSFRIEEQGGLTVQGMVDGVSDVFTDQSGVDTATSTDEVYNAAGDYYENPGVTTVASAVSEFTGDTGNWTFSGADILHLGTSESGIRTVDTFAGDFSLDFTLTGLGHSSIIGAYPVSEDGSFIATGGGSYAGGMLSMTNSVFMASTGSGTGTPYHGSSYVTPVANAFANGTTIKFERVGSTFKWYVGGALTHTFAYTTSVEMRIVFGSNNALNCDNISWSVPDDPLNSVIVSDTFTALSQPDTAFVTVWHEDVDACTPNTDFTVEVSRDAGTTWTAGTLALATTLGAARNPDLQYRHKRTTRRYFYAVES
jgi:hypothetical protein